MNRSEQQRALNSARRHGDQGILLRSEVFANTLEQISSGRTNPFNLVVDEQSSPVEAVVDGKPTLLFGTNSYLGLNFAPECIAAASEALKKRGTGSTASRAAGGNYRENILLENEIAEFYGYKYATVYSTGFMANLGAISALVREGDAVYIDSHSHASIFDACRLSGAHLQIFRHNDAQHLQRLFDENSIPGSRTLVALEGVYSVWGDVGNLTEIVSVAKTNGAVVLVDEAHSLGAYGERGCGASEQLGIMDKADVIVGTFSKSVGVIGGYSVTNAPQLRSLRYSARPYLYTASLPPAMVAAARTALRLIASGEAPRERLWSNARQLHSALKDIGLNTCAEVGPVGSIRMPGLVECYLFWKALLDKGILVNLLMPPATPNGEALLRFSVSASHTDVHLAKAVEAFEAASRQLG